MTAVLYIGLGVFVVGGIGLLIAAFRTNVWWGLGCIVIAPVAILYTLLHWQEAKNPFLLQLFGLAILLGGAYGGGAS